MCVYATIIAFPYEFISFLILVSRHNMAHRRPVPSSVRVDDPDAASIVNLWLEEDGDDAEDESVSSDVGTGIRKNIPELCSDDDDSDYILSDHDTNSECSEISSDERDAATSVKDQNYYYGKNEYKWAVTPPVRNVRTPAHNILRLPRLKPPGATQESLTPMDSFQIIFSDSMLNVILTWTNNKLEELRGKYPNDAAFRETHQVELKGFLSLLIYTAIFKSNRESVLSLFATDGSGREIFRASMSKNRFMALLLALRFDNFSDRSARKESDPACPISEILEMFVVNSQQNYSLGANATVDEMLIPFRGRSKFKMYMPNKPGKYGLKLQCLVDARTGYTYNVYLYTGKGSDGFGLGEEERKKSVPTQAVLRLCRPIFNTNMNITTDNWYSSMELLQELKKKGLTTVGTLKKNKKEIPKEFLPNKNRSVGSTLFGFSKDCTLVSYVPKKNRAVILYSSMHHDNDINPTSNKPDIIEYYNNTKSGVDSVDQKCSVYSCSRRTTRWPLAVFFRILDMSALNAQVIYESQRKVPKHLTRLNFLKSIAEKLNENNLMTRLHNNHLPRQLRSIVSTILACDIPEDFGQLDVEHKLPRNDRKYCYLCHYKKRTKTAYLCCTCKKPVCLSCSMKICRHCVTEK